MFRWCLSLLGLAMLLLVLVILGQLLSDFGQGGTQATTEESVTTEATTETL